MKPSIANKLGQLHGRLEELNGLLATQDATRDMDSYRRLSREHAELTPVVELYDAWRRSEGDVGAAQEMAADPEMREFAEIGRAHV